MSDQQENPDTESVSSSASCEQAEPTPGPWQIATSCSYRRIVNDRMSPVCVPTVQSADGHPDLYFPNGGANGPDARLIAAAGTAAQEAKEMGYDPVAVQEALPKILSAAEELLGRVEDDCRVRDINPYDEPSFTALEYALKSAEGSRNE